MACSDAVAGESPMSGPAAPIRARPVWMLWVALPALVPPSAGHRAGIERTGPPDDPSVPVVVLSTSTWTADETVEVETKGFVQSLLATEPGPVHLVFISNAAAAEKARKWLKGCAAGSRLTVHFVRPPIGRIVAEVGKYKLRGPTPLDHHAGVAGVVKFFIADVDVLPNYHRAIVYDADVLLGRPISHLWAEFERFAPGAFWGSNTLRDTGMGSHAVCSCLSLFDLDKMRKWGWLIGSARLRRLFNGAQLDGGCAEPDADSSPKARALYAACIRTNRTRGPQRRGYQGGVGDQALNTWVYNRWPETMHAVPRTWMLSNCQKYYGIDNPTLPTGGADVEARLQNGGSTGNTAPWGAVHFNCAQMSVEGKGVSFKSKTRMVPSPWRAIASFYYGGVMSAAWRACERSGHPRMPLTHSASSVIPSVPEGCTRCPVIFGLGHQKSGTTTVLYALGSAANLTVANDVQGFWREQDLSDQQVCSALDSGAAVQKEGHAWKYLATLRRICPSTAFYVVERDDMDVVRSVADRLHLRPEEGCEALVPKMPYGWRPLFWHSNDSSCLVRIAASVRHMRQNLASAAAGAPRIQYEEYVRSSARTIAGLCDALGLDCNTARMDLTQKQRKGKHHGADPSALWPVAYVDRIRAAL